MHAQCKCSRNVVQYIHNFISIIANYSRRTRRVKAVFNNE